jgi:hypothetical protein
MLELAASSSPQLRVSSLEFLASSNSKLATRNCQLETGSSQAPASPKHSDYQVLAPALGIRELRASVAPSPRRGQRLDNSIIVEQTSMTNNEAPKGAGWMVRLSEAMKDVLSCEKPGGDAPNL